MKRRNAKGFTLIEMVIVIAIIAILASILIPSLMHYIKKARKAAAIADAKIILTGTQTAVLEKGLAESTMLTKKNGVINGKKVDLGGISNTAINNALNHTTSTNQTDTDIAKSIVDMISNAGVDPGNAKRGRDIFGKNCKSYTDSIKANYSFIILYTADGEVPFMQIYNKGILVTYANGNFIANDSDDAKFINLGNSFTLPYIQAGVDNEDIPVTVQDSKFPTVWG